ncbi:MAG: hypothetical protein ACK4YP_12845 [Myxococcota bacterium]
MRVAAVLLFPLLAACPGRGFEIEPDFAETGATFSCGVESDEPLGAGFVTALEPDGCRWMITALDEEGFRSLTLDVPAFAEAVAGASVSTSYTLPDDHVRLEVRTGCGLAEGACTEARSAPLVVRTYTPTAGTVTVDAAPNEDGALATVTLTAVELLSDFEETATIGAVTWTDVKLYPAPVD